MPGTDPVATWHQRNLRIMSNLHQITYARRPAGGLRRACAAAIRTHRDLPLL